MTDRERLVALILDVASEFNAGLDHKIDIARGDAAPLFGRDGALDSIALVSFTVAVEQTIEDQLGRSVSLADEKAMSAWRSPFKTVGSFADYAGALIAKADGE